jgi:hypothetical protein
MGEIVEVDGSTCFGFGYIPDGLGEDATAVLDRNAAALLGL